MSSTLAPMHRACLTPLRLTRRGRTLVLLLSAAVALLILAVGAQAVRASSSSNGAATGFVSVQAGDTLWSIAHSIAPTKDPRDVVARISDLNNLHSATVRAGDVLVVPAVAR